MSPFPPHRRAILLHCLLMAGLGAGAYYVPVPTGNPAPQTGSSGAAYYHVPDLSVMEMPDFASIHDIELKKKAFFDFLQPYIDAKNAEVRRQRLRLQLIAA
ncbi:MAG TPA: hypothetical protein VMH83_05190, partial [Candidatus Acidoferrum sp.]|nr:hypothetical protein [Candidatus Acidoferrum sp.]